jgi:hypothetical protein
MQQNPGWIVSACNDMAVRMHFRQVIAWGVDLDRL